MDNNKFQQAAMLMIEDAYVFVTRNDQIPRHRECLNPVMFAMEFGTVRIQSHRQAGHTTLINQLAFDVGNELGRMYSTLVMAPTIDRAVHNFEPGNLYCNSEDDRRTIINELGIEYANEYRSVVRDVSSSSTGKVLAASHFESMGFSVRPYLRAQRKAIFELTGKEVDKFDMMLIDGASAIKQQTLDRIYMTFCNDVELFVLFQ